MICRPGRLRFFATPIRRRTPLSKNQLPSSDADAPAPVTHVLTQEQRDALSPDDVLKRLMEGNERFVSGRRTSRDHARQVRDAARGQSPMAVILSCLDSRIPVEDVFDQGIGDVFVARVAGNFENTDILGSMEFGCLSQDPDTRGGGAKLIFVLGHERCGAISHAINGTDAGNITAMLKNIKPAIEATVYDGERSRENYEFVNLVAQTNVRLTVARIQERSAILRALAQGNDLGEEPQIKIVGGLYQMETGEVVLLTA